MQNAYPSHLLFILGMHRSGTSALSRIFNLLGFSAPKTLMKANRSNETGHWESTPIARLNDEILEAMQLTWQDWDLGSTASLRAVMKSLEKRNDMLATQAGLLWLKHVLDAVQSSAGMPRAFVSYETLLKEPVPEVTSLVDALGLEAPYSIDAVGDQITEFLSPDLEHHSFSAIDVAHDPFTGTWIKEAYEALLVLCKDPDSKGALDRLSEISAQFTQANDILVAAANSYTTHAAALQAKTETLHEQIAGLDQEAADLRLKTADLQRDQAKIKSQNSALEIALRDAAKTSAKAQSSVAELSPRLKASEKELRQLKRQFYRLKDELAWTKDIIHQLEGSTSWRVTSPLRKFVRLLRGTKPGAAAAPPQIAGRQGQSGAGTGGERASNAGTADESGDSNPAAPPAIKPADLIEQIGVLERSKDFDKAYYLSTYPDAQLHPDGPEAHYILEGWRKGYRPNTTFETAAYLAANPELAASNQCPLVHFIKNQDQAPRAAQVLNGSGPPRIAVFTAIAGGYDDLKDPEFISDHADYFVFTDGHVPAGSVWQKRPFEFISHDPTRTARFIKTHPHLYFQDYDWAIWMDANLQLVEAPESLLPQSGRDDTFLTWSHPLRDCVYEEGEECIRRSKDDTSGIEAQIASLRARGFPEHAGLFETSVIVAKMNDPHVEELYKVWWAEISRWSKRDQLSLPVAVEATDLPVGHLARHTVCMRTDPRFVYYRHSAA